MGMGIYPMRVDDGVGPNPYCAWGCFRYFCPAGRLEGAAGVAGAGDACCTVAFRETEIARDGRRSRAGSCQSASIASEVHVSVPGREEGDAALAKQST
ncbi:hypothetical protein ACVISU_005421 [Bradyrhizobium sp. USDA 4452]